MATKYNLIKWLTGLIGYFVTAALIIGCANTPEEPEKSFFDEWKARVAESQAYTPPPKKQLKVIDGKGKQGPAQPGSVISPVEKALPTQKITMKMSDIDVAVLLRALAKVANQNIVLSDKIAGKVNINITQAPWDQVFKSLLRTQGLTYAWTGDIIRILTIQDMENELQQESQRIELSKVEPLITRVVKVSYAPAAKMRENMEKFLSIGRDGNPLGTVLVDEYTNSLIIQAIPRDLIRMIDVVEQLDRPTSQILIQAYIIETTNDTARALGVQWGGALLASSNGKNTWLGPNGVDYNEGRSLKDEDGSDIEYLWPVGNVSNFPVPLPDDIGLSLGFMYQNIGRGLLSLQLQALQDDGKLNILSSPSITTLENQSALIEAGSRIPTQTVENGEVNIEYIQAVLRLEVTPNVIDAETLKLKILTNKDEPDFTRTVAGNPTIVTKKAETNVILFNGQTTVIGGLSKETKSDSSAGIPYVKDVPGLGWLFGSRSRTSGMEDVLIFITPYILEEKPPDQASTSAGRTYQTGNPPQ